MPLPSHDLTIVDTDSDHLTGAYRGLTNISGLLGVLLARQQTLEDQTWAVISSRLIGTSRAYVPDPADPTNEEKATLVEIVLDAADAHLDTVGKLVGEARLGRSDAEYRVAVRVRIRVNRSEGRAEDVLQVAAQAVPLGVTATYTEHADAAFTVRAEGLVGVPSLGQLIGDARAGGVRGLLEYSAYVPTKNFRFSSSYGVSSGDTRGYASSYGGTIESRYIGVLET